MKALKSPDEVALQAALVDRLRREAPASWKCIFLNCELRETPGGMSASGDLFAVTKSLLGRPKREQWVLGADSLKIAFELGRLACSLADQPHVTVDLIISKDGSVKSFADFGPLRRLNGGDDFFKGKHKVYIDHMGLKTDSTWDSDGDDEFHSCLGALCRSNQWQAFAVSDNARID